MRGRQQTTRTPLALALATLLFAAAAMPGIAQGRTAANPLHTASREELDVIKVLLAQEKAWNNGDIEGFVSGYKDSPETLFIGRQVSRGFAEIVAEYKHDYPSRSSMGVLGYSELEVHPLSNSFAACIGRYHLDRSKKEGGGADGLFSVVLEKTDQGWKIVVDHTT
ncbi:MAG: nuclear transport factor 2 family protein [Acidobacteriota bacterium]|nr:nuclear transport factor 2 family protein [Acidobacteriota bacterium]